MLSPPWQQWKNLCLVSTSLWCQQEVEGNLSERRPRVPSWQLKQLSDWSGLDRRADQLPQKLSDDGGFSHAGPPRQHNFVFSHRIRRGRSFRKIFVICFLFCMKSTDKDCAGLSPRNPSSGWLWSVLVLGVRESPLLITLVLVATNCLMVSSISSKDPGKLDFLTGMMIY